MSNTRPKGPQDLAQEVHAQGMCTNCGLCVGMCPYVKTIDERIVNIQPCGLTEGNCYRVCPRTPTDWGAMDEQTFGTDRADHVLGNYRGLFFARALDQSTAEAGQYGGVVSALMGFALERGMVSGAVLTTGVPGEFPRPTLATTREEVLASAGSKYTGSPSLTALNQAVREGHQNLAVVGRPCQVLAVRKMQGLQGTPEFNLSAREVSLVVGIFCFWALKPEFYDFVRQKANGARITRVDIPIEGLMIHTTEGIIKVPVDDIRQFIRPACQECFDPSAEFADVAVGSTEYDDAWNTLVVRSGHGQDLVDAAVQAGVIETKPYPEERLPILRTALTNKKLRVLKAQEERGEGAYLQLSEAYREGIAALAGGNNQ